MKAPKGKLIPIGGNEARDYGERDDSDKKVDFSHGVLTDVMKEIAKKEPVIEILTIASSHQHKMVRAYRKAFEKLGYDVDFINEDQSKELDSDENLEKIQQADCVFISGGDQVKVKDMLHKTRFVEVIKRRYREEDFVVAGTSAGAMILADFMIDEGGSEESLLKGITSLVDGLGLLNNAIIDTHFMSRGRIARLIEAVIMKRDHVGIGLCEDTAIMISKGHEIIPIGSGSVTIVEPFGIRKTNYEKVSKDDPVFLENLNIHFLAKGTMYDLSERRFLILEESLV